MPQCFRREPIDPLVCRDRLAGVGIRAHRGPVAFLLDLLVRNGAFHHEHERVELAFRRVEPILHELVAHFVGDDRIVHMHFRQPGNVPHDQILDAGLGRGGDRN